jgi:hypothetical protein
VEANQSSGNRAICASISHCQLPIKLPPTYQLNVPRAVDAPDSTIADVWLASTPYTTFNTLKTKRD